MYLYMCISIYIYICMYIYIYICIYIYTPVYNTCIYKYKIPLKSKVERSDFVLLSDNKTITTKNMKNHNDYEKGYRNDDKNKRKCCILKHMAFHESEKRTKTIAEHAYCGPRDRQMRVLLCLFLRFLIRGTPYALKYNTCICVIIVLLSCF